MHKKGSANINWITAEIVRKEKRDGGERESIMKDTKRRQ